MNITDIPFNRLLGISTADNTDYLLQLDARKEYTNHLGTIHAATLFSLAEGSGAQFLLNSFPVEMVDNFVPVLRKVDVTYKKPTNGVIVSSAKLKDDTIENITLQLNLKKRALLTTTVDLFDIDKTKVFTANFEWFVALKN